MRITTAPQAAHRDASAIAAGVDSWSLMHAAGTAAAHCILTSSAPVSESITVVAGTGNNGGDAYVIAAVLRRLGFNVLLMEVGEPRTPDAKRARLLYEETLAEPLLRASGRGAEGRALDVDVRLAAVLGPTAAAVNSRASSPEGKAWKQPSPIVVDGILGTGQRGALREAEWKYAALVNDLASNGAFIISLDVPTGVNATTGEIAEGAVRAHHTLAFGTLKRAHVLQREQCGAVTVLDIGLGEHADVDDGAWLSGEAAQLSARVPRIEWNAYKGTRGKLALLGGTVGMAGAVVLASESALRSGVGLLHAHVHAESLLAMQIAVPQALAHGWNENSEHGALAIGPGLGRLAESAQALDHALENLSPGVALLLDADALTLLAADTNRLRALAVNRSVLCTPHVGEFARMLGQPVATTFADRVEQAVSYATHAGVTLLLKGTPTVIVEPYGIPVIVARGNAALATGGSGDMLTGIAGTLLAQGVRAAEAGAIAAWVHGRAAEIAVARAGGIRGVTLRAVLNALPEAWASLMAPRDMDVVLGELPSVAHPY